MHTLTNIHKILRKSQIETAFFEIAIHWKNHISRLSASMFFCFYFH